MKLGIYVRVSSEGQATKGVSLDNQIKKGIECSTRFSFDEYQVYKDAGISGSKGRDERPQLKQLFDDVSSKKVQGVYVYDIDRLSRDFIEFRLLKDIIVDTGNRLFDASGEIDLKSASSGLLTDIRGLLANFETDQLSNRIKDNLLQSAMNGRIQSGPIKPYGFKKDDKKMMVIDETEAKNVELMYKLYLEGLGTKRIAEHFNTLKIPSKRSTSSKGYMMVRGVKQTEFKWRDTTIYRILTNPLYKGIRVHNHNGVAHEIPCPQIIDVDVWDAVQEAMKTRQNTKDTTNKYFYLLKGKIKCSCGRRMYGRKREDLSDNQYICISQRNRNEFCGTRGVNIDYLNDLVWDNLLNLPSGIEKFFERYESTNEVKTHQKRYKQIEKGIEEYEEKIANLVDMILDKTITKERAKPRMTEFEETIKALNTVKNHYDNYFQSMNDKDGIIQVIQDSVKVMKKKLSDEEKKRIINSLISQISIEWDKEEMKHDIHISYQIGRLTQFQLGAGVELRYKKNGWRLDRNKQVIGDVQIFKNLQDELNLPEISQYNFKAIFKEKGD